MQHIVNHWFYITVNMSKFIKNFLSHMSYVIFQTWKMVLINFMTVHDRGDTLYWSKTLNDEYDTSQNT